jgi:hypothetical protein
MWATSAQVRWLLIGLVAQLQVGDAPPLYSIWQRLHSAFLSQFVPQQFFLGQQNESSSTHNNIDYNQKRVS